LSNDPNKRRIQHFTELAQFTLHPPSVRMLPLAFCQHNSVVVLNEVDRTADDEITVGTLSPDDPILRRNLSKIWHRPIRMVALNLFEINRALELGFGLVDTDKRRERARARLVLDSRLVDPLADAVALTDDVIRQALRLRATDIHIEAYRDDADVRLRIDGVLQQLQTPISPDNIASVVSRLKVLSSLDITERREPQDGRFRVAVVEPATSSEWDCDFRLSIVPGPHGEDAVIRVLGGRVGVMPIGDLGMSGPMQSELLALLSNPEGLILVTGPTGSGKTTTLYSTIHHLNTGKRKILTVEDPIEYELEKVNQKQSSHRLSMAALTRAFLRQDPDIILIGEVRDQDTADVAIRAASTGHLVLSTLHTPDALGTLLRLKGMGLGADRLAEALLGIVAQRLLRRICAECCGPAEITPLHRERLRGRLEGLEPVAGAGCERCHHTGFRGRVGIYELLIVTTDLQDEIAEGAHIHDIREALAHRGFKTMVDDAMDKVRDGVTSLDEVLRVLPYRYLQNVS
jgi:type II secretory ATPase GspE/PulE/Tfp pilus assembly ATPase PilB-like protein